MIKSVIAFVAIVCMTVAAPTNAQDQSNDGSDSTLVVINGHIWTANPKQPWAEAIVVTGARITFVGSTDGALELTSQVPGPGSQVVDAAGKFVAPGFIDSHVHFLTGGSNLMSVQLRDATTKQDFVLRLAAFAKTVPPGTWITGGDWDHTLWGGDLPERSWIDHVTPDHPVWVNRLDGHMALANTAALEAAGVSDDPAEIEGGEIVRDELGRLTGLLKDNAMGLIYRAIPDDSDDRKLDFIEAASDYVASNGVTSVHDVDGWLSIDLYKAARESGRLKTRVYGCAPISRRDQLATYIEDEGPGDEWVRTGCVKGFVDGSLGSHTAAMFEPFDDEPDDRGLLMESEESLQAKIFAADALGLHLAIHAIGDRANHILLNIFEAMIAEHGEGDRRMRIEHAQHLSRNDIPRFAELGVIPSMQPYHAIDDGRWAEDYIGADRAETTYAFRSLLDAGARPAFGSDWFVAPPTPLEGIYAAVTRRTLDEARPDGWVPSQKITVEEALRAYTIDAAYASFEEDVKGSLEVGKLADFVIIDRDLTEIDPVEIRLARVEMTVVGGEVIFERN